jgi:hypothetical protein
MAITAGSNANASDFVSTSAGAGDSGKVAKLNASGKFDKTFPSRWGCRVKSAAGQSYSTGTTIAFGAEDFDDDTMHDNVTNNTRITIKTPGTYMIGANVAGSATTSTLGVKLQLNGTTMIASGGGGYANNGGSSVVTVRTFALNDYIEVIAYANSANNSSADESTNFWAILLQST